MRGIGLVVRGAVIVALSAGMVRASLPAAPCVGDCGADRVVTVDELIRAVNVALGNRPLQDCPAVDGNDDGQVTIEDLVQAVASALGGCPHCADHDPLRNLYWGDLHVHTELSFDANVFGVRTGPGEAYRFARGEAVHLPPLDDEGEGTREVRIDRPLDFAAVTDHAEFLGEVSLCTTPGSPGFSAATCQEYRAGTNDAIRTFGTKLAIPQARIADVCGADGARCVERAGVVWERIQDVAEEHIDRSASCTFTTFVAYEYSGNPGISTRHRNVIFRNREVPFPVTWWEEITAEGLWQQLRTLCLDAAGSCDVLAIPHNSNESNGGMFLPQYPGAETIEDERRMAAFRSRIEPIVEIFQHKGDSECLNGVEGILGAPDELCDFEKRRRPPFEDCGDSFGTLGVVDGGCVSRRDYVRGALLAGLEEARRIGANPFRLGIIAATDTHNGTPGEVGEREFEGHRGLDDDTPGKRLGPGELQPGGVAFNPGGLTAIWARENSRDSLFRALRRREVFGTSGPRIRVRFFGGDLDDELCQQTDMVARADRSGVPMGGTLPVSASDAGPRFLVSALRDPGTEGQPGTPLQRIQIIKGWVDAAGAHQRVHDVAGDPENGADVDLETCVPRGEGFDSLCAVWEDPDFDPTQPAFYYARVLENPTCRWSTHECNRLPVGDRPPACSDLEIPRTIQERAWTSPIWYEPRRS